MYRKYAILRVMGGGLLVPNLAAATPALAAPPLPPPVPQIRAYVQFGPPRPFFERRIVAPGRGYVWINGYHRWNGRRYVWVPGHWQRPPRLYARWVSPRWRY